MDAGKGTKTKIKLIQNKDGEAIFPGYFASINREGKAYINNNFIGDKIAFSTKEMTAINNAKNAVPTKVNNTPKVDAPIVPPTASAASGVDDTFDFPLL